LYGAPISGLSEEAGPSNDPRGKKTAPALPGLVDYSTDDDDNDNDNGSDNDDDRDYTEPYSFFATLHVSRAYPFWHLMPKGEC
jgi:hypothetical protein